MKIELTLNGTPRTFEIHPGTLLMELLRSEGLHSVKHGCETGECGSCSVLVDGHSLNACIYLAAQAHKREVLTAEYLGSPDHLHPLQEAFVETGAIQCGYCTPAMLMAAYELLLENPQPTESQVRDAFSGTLCRCTGYVKPVEAVLKAAEAIRSQGLELRPHGAGERPEPSIALS